MLQFLRIKNLALIDDLELDFAPGLNVLTGETGAGKSFILKALGFITGERMSPELVRPGADKAQVEAIFTLDDEDLILRRELVTETGRSRLFVNDRLSSQDSVRDLKPRLMLHTSQHGQERLLHPSYQAQILDAFLDEPDLLARKDQLVAALKQVLAARQEVEARTRELSARREFLEFQRQEIDKVAPMPGEEDELLGLKQAQAGLERAKQSLAKAQERLLARDSGLLESLGLFQRELEAVAKAEAEFLPDCEALAQARAALQDLAGRLRRIRLGNDDVDLEALESRLYELSSLKRRLKRTLPEILALKAEIDENLTFLDVCGLDMARLDKEERRLSGELHEVLASLGQARRRAALHLAARLVEELKGLGFSEHVGVEFDFAPREVVPGLDSLVEDRARILWIPNPGQPPQALDKIASGGELSRFLLATTTLLSDSDRPALIFDEVDSGVGGLTLNRVGERIRQLASRQQVILITHWPQLASLADRHFQVAKEVRHGETFTQCQRLDQGEVVAELARMAGGGEQGQELARRLKGL